MIPTDNRASPEACDADNQCLHGPCFQVEPAAGGRQPTGEDHPDLHGFAFSTIPLDSGAANGRTP